jgi:hypothetical protein
MALYVDLLVENDDLVLDAGGEPQQIYDRDCIVQDIKHLVRDSGLLVEIIGERDQQKVKASLLKLTLLIEDDERLIPGTVAIAATDHETFFITANTYEFGGVRLTTGA